MKVSTIAISLASVVISGCSVWGGKSFQCPATDMDGATCMSAREIYQATHVTDRVAPNYRDGKRIEGTERPSSAPKPEDGAAIDSMPRHGGSYANYVPPLPDMETPLPVRMPAKVMRIRMFAWEDNQKDLNAGGLVFTEVEGRQWTLGDESVSRVQTNVISPLAMPKQNSPSGQNQSPLSMPTSPRSQQSQQHGQQSQGQTPAQADYQAQQPAPGKRLPSP